MSSKISEADESEEQEDESDGMLDEDQMAEIRKAKISEKLKILAKKAEKVDKFEMFKADIGADDKIKGPKGKAKAKAKTQKGKAKSGDSDDEVFVDKKPKPKTARR